MSDKLLHKILENVISMRGDIAGISARLDEHEKKHDAHDQTHKDLHKRISDAKPKHVPFRQALTGYVRDYSLIAGAMAAIYKFFIDKTV